MTERFLASHHLIPVMEQIIAATRTGRMIIITDHPHRENEGDFFVAAEHIDSQLVNTMLRDGRGMICCPVSQHIARTLRLTPQIRRNRALHGTRFTVSVDSRTCAGSGISAIDRAHTIKTLSCPNSRAHDLVRPGHVFPIVANPRGLDARPGHTEAAVALLRLAHLRPVGVICEIIAEDGTMARGEVLRASAKRWKMPIISVAEIMKYLEISEQ